MSSGSCHQAFSLLLSVLVWECWLGKTSHAKAGSTLELIWNALAFVFNLFKKKEK